MIHHFGLLWPRDDRATEDRFSPGRERRSRTELFGPQRQGVPCCRGDGLTAEGPVEEFPRGPGLELVRDV